MKDEALYLYDQIRDEVDAKVSIYKELQSAKEELEIYKLRAKTYYEKIEALDKKYQSLRDKLKVGNVVKRIKANWLPYHELTNEGLWFKRYNTLVKNLAQALIKELTGEK